MAILKVGDRFTIDDAAYRRFSFECVEDKPQDYYRYKALDAKGDMHFFAECNLEFYGDKVKIKGKRAKKP